MSDKTALTSEQREMKSFKVESKPQIDRVILGKKEADIVSDWTQRLNARADGLIKFTKADVVNFLIRNHIGKLDELESGQIARDSYDETKWLGWALSKIKKAKKSGETLSFDDLIKFRDELIGGAPKLKRKTRKRDDDNDSPEESMPIAVEPDSGEVSP